MMRTMFDTNDNDMFWISNSQFVIQAVQNFNDDQIIPLDLLYNEGKSIIKIDALENIHLKFTYMTMLLNLSRHKKQWLSYFTPIGEYNKRSLQFVNKLYDVDKTRLAEGIFVYYTNNNEMLNIKTVLLTQLSTKYTFSTFRPKADKLTTLAKNIFKSNKNVSWECILWRQYV
jgi:hypothetical protein